VLMAARGHIGLEAGGLLEYLGEAHYRHGAR